MGHLKGCGVLTAAAAPITHAIMKFPPGCFVWARDLNAFIPMGCPQPTPAWSPHQLPEDGRTISSHAFQRSHFDSPVDSPRHGADRDNHGRHHTEVTMNHTQALEQQAFTQARGTYDVRALQMYEVGSRSASKP